MSNEGDVLFSNTNRNSTREMEEIPNKNNNKRKVLSTQRNSTREVVISLKSFFDKTHDNDVSKTFGVFAFFDAPLTLMVQDTKQTQDRRVLRYETPNTQEKKKREKRREGGKKFKKIARQKKTTTTKKKKKKKKKKTW